EKIHNAQFKNEPDGFKELSQEEISQARKMPFNSPVMPKQEKGIRPSCALPYQLYADGNYNKDKECFEVNLSASKDILTGTGTGAPFTIYAPGLYKKDAKDSLDRMKNWQYAVAAGDTLTDAWPINSFESNQYHLRVHGPNGFYREFKGFANDPALRVSCVYEKDKRNNLTGNVVLTI